MLYLIETFNPNSQLVDEITIPSHAYKSAINTQKNGAEKKPKTALKKPKKWR